MLLRTSHVLLEILAVILASSVLALVFGAWTLSRGPVSLGFLKNYVATELAENRGSVDVEFEDLILKWAGWERALDIVAVNTSIKTRDGVLLASAPEISLSLSVAALIGGEIAPTSLELIRPHVYLVRNKNREFGIGGVPGAANEETNQIISMVIDALAEKPDVNSPLRQLKKISLVGAEITVDDPLIGGAWGSRHADISVYREADGIRITYDMDIDFGGQSPTLSGTIQYRPGDGEFIVATQFQKLRPDMLGSSIERLAPLKAFRVPLAGSANFRITTDGKVQDLTFDFSGGEGVLVLPHSHLRTSKVKSIYAIGRADAKQNQLVVTRLAIDLGGPKIEISGSVTQFSDYFGFNAHAVVTALPVNDLSLYWPPDVASGANEWVIQNIREGQIADAQVDMSGRIETAAGEISFSKFGATAKIKKTDVHFFRPMSPVRETDLSIVFKQDRIDIQVDHGVINGISISEGNVALTELTQDAPNLETNLVLRSGLSDALILLNHPNLGWLTKLGFDPATIKGNSAIRVSAQFPLIKDLNLAQIDIRAAANLADVSAPTVAFGRDLTQGQFALRVDRETMSIIGTALIDGVPGEIAWYENFVDGAIFTRRYDMQAKLDDAARRRFGFDFGKALTGPVFADLSYVEVVNKDPTLYLKLKLDDAAISIPFLKWSKLPGKDGFAELEIDFQKGRMAEIRGYRIAADGLHSSGSAIFAEDGETIKSLLLNKLALGERTNISGTVERLSDGSFEIALHGPQLDLAPYFDDENDDAGPSKAIALRGRGTFDKIWVGSETAVENVDVDVEHDGQSWRRVSLNGNIAKGKKFSADYVNETIAGRLELYAADAGNVLTELGLKTDLRGGVLSLSAVRQGTDSAAPWRGTLGISDFVLTKAPFIAQLLTLASLTGISNVLSGKGVEFHRLNMPFTYASDRIEIVDARAVGSELGITGEGSIDLGKKLVDLEGTLVPAYTINSFLGNIPVLGPLFTGSKGSGIFAATYSMKGDFENVHIEVNPLAALAPGFLRELIRGIGKAGNPGPPPGLDVEPGAGRQ